MGFNQANPAAEVSESDQFLAEDLQGYRQVFEIVGEGHRLPEAAQILPAGGSGADSGKFGVLLGYFSMVVSAVAGGKKRCSSGHANHLSRQSRVSTYLDRPYRVSGRRILIERIIGSRSVKGQPRFWWRTHGFPAPLLGRAAAVNDQL